MNDEQTGYQNIILQHDGPIARLTLDRPDARNAMSSEMGREIRDAVGRINGEESTRVVVVRGAGRAFSGGGDLQSLEEEAAAATEGRARGPGLGGGRTFYSLFLSVRDLRVPSIAAINGHAIGAGLCFALGCDLRVIHEQAKVGMTFVKVGIHPGMAATWNLPRLIGPARAAELLYTGRLLDAGEAVAWGIASRAAGADFDQVVDDLAGQIAGCAPVAVRLVKQTLRGTFDRDVDAALALEADQQAATFRTHDALEGIRAIREKRPPEFSGA